MMIIGCDYHPGFQQIAYVDTDTGEVRGRRLEHKEEAEQFYRGCKMKLKAPSSKHSTLFDSSSSARG